MALADRAAWAARSPISTQARLSLDLPVHSNPNRRHQVPVQGPWPGEERTVEVTVLAVPGCSNAAVLEQRLAEALAGRPAVPVTRRVIADADEAARWGMAGPPTLLVDGRDPFRCARCGPGGGVPGGSGADGC